VPIPYLWYIALLDQTPSAGLPFQVTVQHVETIVSMPRQHCIVLKRLDQYETLYICMAKKAATSDNGTSWKKSELYTKLQRNVALYKKKSIVCPTCLVGNLMNSKYISRLVLVQHPIESNHLSPMRFQIDSWSTRMQLRKELVWKLKRPSSLSCI
jgi:hypothetical protein